MLEKLIVRLILVTFFFTSIGPLPDASAQSMIDLPVAGVMVNTSLPFQPLQLKGILVNIKDPLRFDFLIDKGDSSLYGTPLKDEITRLAKYFLTCLTVPEDDLWVNLSPYEKDRIVPGNFGITLMGKDLLEQDYLLKQIMASLSYPENDLGKRFWQRVYRRSYELYGTTEIPINTFNKVWIVPKSAQVYVQGNAAFVVNSQLDVMLEADYRSFVHHLDDKSLGMSSNGSSQRSGAYSQVFRDVILPELRQEINTGKNFAVVRQVYNAMILATWYKRHLKDSILGRNYVGKNEVFGIDIADKDAKERIYHQYLRAYKKCVYNYIKEDYDPATDRTVPRKYASGGMNFVGLGDPAQSSAYKELSTSVGMGRIRAGNLAMATVDFAAIAVTGKRVIDFPDPRSVLIGTYPFRQFSPLNDQAMSVRSSLRMLTLSVLLAVGGMLMTPTTLAAASPVSPVKIEMAANTNINAKINSIDNKIHHLESRISFLNSPRNILHLFGDPGNALRDLKVLDSQRDQLIKEQRIANDQITHHKHHSKVSSHRSLTPSPKHDTIAYDLDLTALRSYFDALKLDWNIKNDPQKVYDLQVKLRHDGYTVIKEATGNIGPQTVEALRQAAGKVQAADQLAKQQAADQLAKQQAADQLAKQQAADQLAKQQAADQLAKQQAADQLAKQQAADQLAKQQAADQLAKQQPENKVSPANNHFIPRFSGTKLLKPSTSGIVHGSTTPAPDIAGGSPPPPDKTKTSSFILQYLQANWPDYLSYSLFGIGLASLAAAGILKRKKNKKLKIRPVDRISQPSVFPPPTEGNSNFDVTLPPPQASDSEKQVLAVDLANMKAMADGRLASPLKQIPLEDDTQSNGKTLWWMNIGALVGGLGLSLFLGGGVPWVLGLVPFITGGFYVAQKILHEWLHLIPAAVAYHPRNLSTTFSVENLRANLTLGQWVRSLIPFTRKPRAEVILPFTKIDENSSWWDKFRNRFVGWVGLFGSVSVAIAAGYLIGLSPFLLAPLVFSALAVTKEGVESGDLWGSNDTDQGKFGCGIMGIIMRVPFQGVSKKSVKGWVKWIFKATETSLSRGGQQAGGSIKLNKPIQTFIEFLNKVTKNHRNWRFWQTWDKGPVFYDNIINILYKRFLRVLPNPLVPVYTFAKNAVLKFVFHVRFATNGDMLEEAAHPFSSPREKIEQMLYDSVNNTWKKVTRFFNVTSAFNGDSDASRLGVVPFRNFLFGQPLGFAQMRRFFSAVVHSYYQGKVTTAYLRENVNNGKKYEQEVGTDYGKVLKALRKKGYINSWGKVSPRFVKLDDEFKGWFPKYKEEVFNEIESALFGMPPGDAPINPLAQHLFLTIGNWFGSVRYAHVMANHRTKQEAMDDILFENEGRAVGGVYSEVFDKVAPFLLRRGYTPDPEKTRLLSDSYVKDEETAKRLGLEDQYRMIEIFKKMLYERMELEAGKNTLAGKVFRQWEDKWRSQGEDVAVMRRRFIDVAVEKYFTGDSIASTKEFAERSEGSFGIFLENPLDDSITLYQNNQDVVIGFNEKAGVIAFGSDPRALKTVGPNGEKVDQVMHLIDGEVVNVSFSPTGKVIVRSWIKDDEGHWTESTPQQLAERMYPTAEYVGTVTKQTFLNAGFNAHDTDRLWEELLENEIIDQNGEFDSNGKFYKIEKPADFILPGLPDPLIKRIYGILYSVLEKNPFYAPPPVEYKTTHTVVQEDMQNITKMITQAQTEWEDPDSFNSRATENLADRINEAIKKNGKARVLVVSYGNSLSISKHLNKVFEDLIEAGKLKIIVKDANVFARNYSKYKITPDDVFMLVSKSGATFSTKLALRIIKKLIPLKNIFAVTARKDSVLLPMIGQGLNPRKHRLTDRVFILGDFYPSETPVASEVLLQFQMQQLALNLVRALVHRNSPKAFGLKVSSAARLDLIAKKITEYSIRLAKELTGFDKEGEKYKDENKKVKKIGRYLGFVALEGFVIKWFKYLWGAIVLSCPVVLLGYHPIAYLLAQAWDWLGVHAPLVTHNIPNFSSQLIHQIRTWLMAHASWITNIIPNPQGHLFGALGTWLLLNVPWIFIIVPAWVTERYRSLIGRPHYGLYAPFKIFPVAPEDVVHETQRDFFSRLFTNKYTSMGPGAVYSASSIKDLVTKHSSDIGPGDVVLNFSIKNHEIEGKMGVGQITYPKIGLIGTNSMKGQPETINVVIDIPQELDDLTDDEEHLINDTVGILGQMIASKKIGVEMAKVASFNGRLYNLAYTFSGATVHTTQIIPIPKKVEELLKLKDYDERFPAALTASPAQLAPARDLKPDAAQTAKRDGGINMSSRLMDLKISGDVQDQDSAQDRAMSTVLLKGIVPQVSGIVTVTPDMLKAMLGEGYLN